MSKDRLKIWGISEIYDIKKYPFKLKKRNIVYYQESTGWCSISQYDSKGRCVAYENSDDVFIVRKYDEEGNIIALMDAKTWEREQILNILLED
jgi:hypothetical protein